MYRGFRFSFSLMSLWNLRMCVRKACAFVKLAVSRDGLRHSFNGSAYQVLRRARLQHDRRHAQGHVHAERALLMHAKAGASVAKIVVADQNEPPLRICNAEDTHPDLLYAIERSAHGARNGAGLQCSH
ncbi:hypothetical protein FI667_g4939, partial [Globisporangium splendens]